MHSLAHHFATEAYNNAWANHRLLAACAELTPEEFVARAHELLPVDQGDAEPYPHGGLVLPRDARAQPRGPCAHDNPGRHFEPEEPFESCEDLAREQRAADLRLIALCASLGDGDLDAVVSTRRGRESCTTGCAASSRISSSTRPTTAARCTRCSRARA
jgi:hypothetical protein